MENNIKNLCDRDGRVVEVQLLHDEYERLVVLSRENELLRAKVKQVLALINGECGSSAVEETETTHVPAPVLESEPQTDDIQQAPAVQEPLAQEPEVPQKNQSVTSLPKKLSDFLSEQDPSNKIRNLILSCVQILSEMCEKRITLTLQSPYICLWDFDEWRSFAFGEIIDNQLYISIEKSLFPAADPADVWTPPSGLYKKQLVRIKVDSAGDDLISQLKRALAHPETSA